MKELHGERAESVHALSSTSLHSPNQKLSKLHPYGVLQMLHYIDIID